MEDSAAADDAILRRLFSEPELRWIAPRFTSARPTFRFPSSHVRQRLVPAFADAKAWARKYLSCKGRNKLK